MHDPCSEKPKVEGAQESAPPMNPEDFRHCLRRIQRRQWWLWSSAVAVTLLLTLCVASFAFPGLVGQGGTFESFDLAIAVRGLVGLVLLFNVYVIYQQLQIHRIHYHLGSQLSAMDRMEARTQEVYKLAVLDPLTGLHNRRAGEHRLAEEVSRAQRHHHSLTILMLDLDGLKKVNDMYGHAAGDQMLQAFAEHLSKGTRGSDVAARLGGDEFLVILPECERDQVGHILQRLKGLETHWENHRVPIAFSSGWTSYEPGEPAEEFLKRADQALYVNKRAAQKRPAHEPVHSR